MGTSFFYPTPTILLTKENLKPMLSIIICTYNRDKYIFGALENIAKNDFPYQEYEIILVNNNCTDNTEVECKRFQEAYPNVVFRYFIETNQGLSHARNRGIAEAIGDYLVFLDDDSFVQANYLSTLSNYLQQYPDAAAFGGRIIAEFETGIEPDWMTPWGQSWVSAINLGKKVTLFEGKKYPIGANMGFRKDIINKIGLFNVNLGRSKKNLLAGEEKDLFERIKALGEKIYYFPETLVHHVIPPQRTTPEFIKKLGLGVGMSERIRTKNEGTYLLRLLSEKIKWAATLLLLVRYTLTLQPTKGWMLVVFRWQVTKGLLTASKLG